MKVLCTTFLFCCFSMSAFLYGMQPDSPEKGVWKTVKNVAAVGSVFGGWGFFWATSPRNTTLPTWAKRMPLCGFLASSTAMHAASYFDANPAVVDMMRVRMNVSNDFDADSFSETSKQSLSV